jgi:hypothetical protein
VAGVGARTLAMSATFMPAQRAAVLAVGIVGVLIAGLQPQLLGALAIEGRVSESLLGHVATAELLAMGIGAGGAGFVLPLTNLRRTAALAIVAIASFDLLTPGLGGAMLIADMHRWNRAPTPQRRASPCEGSSPCWASSSTWHSSLLFGSISNRSQLNVASTVVRSERSHRCRWRCR